MLIKNINERLNKFESCHINCKTCSEEPKSGLKMNCDSCKDEFVYDKETKNCNRINIFKVEYIIYKQLKLKN